MSLNWNGFLQRFRIGTERNNPGEDRRSEIFLERIMQEGDKLTSSNTPSSVRPLKFLKLLDPFVDGVDVIAIDSILQLLLGGSNLLIATLRAQWQHKR